MGSNLFVKIECLASKLYNKMVLSCFWTPWIAKTFSCKENKPCNFILCIWSFPNLGGLPFKKINRYYQAHYNMPLIYCLKYQAESIKTSFFCFVLYLSSVLRVLGEKAERQLCICRRGSLPPAPITVYFTTAITNYLLPGCCIFLLLDHIWKCTVIAPGFVLSDHCWLALGTIWHAGDWIWLGDVQGLYPSCCTVALTLNDLLSFYYVTLICIFSFESFQHSEKLISLPLPPTLFHRLKVRLNSAKNLDQGSNCIAEINCQMTANPYLYMCVKKSSSSICYFYFK